MTTIVERVTAQAAVACSTRPAIMAVVNSFIAFFNAVQSAIEYLRDILEIVDRLRHARSPRSPPATSPPAPQMIEQGLAAAIPVAIGFLANQVGIGNVPEKIVEIIGGLRELVDQALDWLIDQALRLGQAALNALDRRCGGSDPRDHAGSARRSPRTARELRGSGRRDGATPHAKTRARRRAADH